MANKQINAILSLKDKFSAPLLKVSKNVDKVSSSTKNATAQVNRMGRKFERSIDNAIKSTFKWTKRVAAIGGGLVLKVGIDGLGELEDGAAKVKSIARDALDTQEIQKGLLQMSTKLGGGITPQEIAEAQYQAISSGIDPADSLDFTEIAGRLRVAGFTDIESAIKILTSTMNAFNLSTLEDANRLADEFLYTQNKGVLTVDEMAQYYGKLTARFASLDLGTKDMNVAIATITKMGLEPAEAVTSLASAVNILSGGSSTAVKNAKELGIVLGGKELKRTGFAGKMSEIIDKTGGDIDKIMSIFPNIRSMLTGLNLTSEQGIKIFKEVSEGFNDSSGLLNEAFETMANTIPYRFKSIKQTMKNYITEFFTDDRIRLPILDRLIEVDEYLKSDEGREKIIDTFDKIYDSMSRMLNKAIEVKDFIIEHQGGIKTFISSLMSLYFTIKLFRGIRKALDILDTFKNLFGKKGLLGGKIKLGGISKVVLAITAVIVIIKHLVDNWDMYKERFPEATQFIEDLLGTIKDVAMWLLEKIPPIFATIKDIFLDLKEIIGNIVEAVVGAALGIITAILWVWDKFLAFGRMFTAMVEGDWHEALTQMEELFGLETGKITEKWESLEEFLDNPLKPIVELATDAFETAADAIAKKWDELKEKLTGKIEAVVEWKEKTKEKGGGSLVKGMFYNANPQYAPKRYTGDKSWRGGIVQVSERGGEVLDLPSGTRIYPHDESVQMAYQEGQKGNSQPIVLNMNIHGNVYGEEDLMNKVGNEMVRELKQVLPNMA